MLLSRDRSAYHVAPLGPGSVVVANLFEPEQFSEHEPSLTGSLADSTVNNRVVVRLVAKIFLINFFEFLSGFECAVGVRRQCPRNVLCPRNMAAAEHTLLRVVGHMGYLASEFAR